MNNDMTNYVERLTALEVLMDAHHTRSGLSSDGSVQLLRDDQVLVATLWTALDLIDAALRDGSGSDVLEFLADVREQAEGREINLP